MKRRIARVKNLRDGERERLALCEVCFAEYSADKADYFMAKESTVLRCCEEPCVIVRKVTRFCAV